MKTIKLECIENPGPQSDKTTIRDCQVDDNVPSLGICSIPVENIHRVYYIPKGLWAYQGSHSACESFIRAVNDLTKSTWPSAVSLAEIDWAVLAKAKDNAELI